MLHGLQIKYGEKKTTDIMVRIAIICVVCIVLLGLVHAMPSRLQDDQEDIKQDGGRYERAMSYGWKHTQYLISNLRQQLNNNDLYFCQGDVFRGIQCPEEAQCVHWDRICDGEQTCGRDMRAACINITIASYGHADDRFCAGDEDTRWCHWKRLAPERCGRDYIIRQGKKRKRFRIRSPDFPQRYPTDLYCFWTVSAEPGRTLSVHFMKFSTEANYDYVSIGQGLRRDDKRSVLIYKHSGNAIPADFKTNRNMANAHQLWISFRSDDWDNDKGFVIEVTDNTVYDAPYIASNPFGIRPNIGCGGVLAVPDGGEVTITSPGYPGYYENNVYYNWTVTARRGRRIEARFTLFDLEENEDFLSLGNGPISRRYPLFYRKTGTVHTYDDLRHISSTSDMWLTFETSVAIARKGFVAKFREVPITDCGGTLTVPDGGSIAIASENYRTHAYRSSTDCTWMIRSERGRRLWVRFGDFNTEWQRDYLSLGNGPESDEEWTTAIISYHSGWYLPNPHEFMSTGDEIWMRFITDRYRNYRGFEVEIFDELSHSVRTTTAEPVVNTASKTP